MEEKTDIELVALARQGDKNAFGQLAERYQMPARRFAMRLVAREDTAQDMAQEAILQAYLSLDKLRDPARFRSWLYGIVLNVSRSHLRDRNNASVSLEAMMGGYQLYAIYSSNGTATPENVTEERELYQNVLDTVNSLSPGDRDITLLFYYAQLNLQEIGELLGISLGAVKVRLHRARQRLKVKLLLQHPEIMPREKRRKVMKKVTIADVVEQEITDEQGRAQTVHIVVLQDEAGRRALPIWIGPSEGQAIVMGLSKFSTQRPMTVNFLASLLQAIDARVEQVRVESLKGTTFYAIVKIRCGKTESEVDARPSDALALAVLTGSPIFVAEDVLERAGADIPEAARISPAKRGVENILGKIEEAHRRAQAQQSRPISQEEFANAKARVVAVVFGN